VDRVPAAVLESGDTARDRRDLHLHASDALTAARVWFDTPTM
jgi:hypothetical protein